MSYQEERLQEIADAIREVKGTTEKIPATNFASEIVGLSVVKPSGIKTITENGDYDVSNYAWASVNVEADLNERVIIGKWVNANGLNYGFQPNGVFYIHEPTFSGTYTIDGFNIYATSDVFGETTTILYVYDEEADTIVQPDTDEILTRVQETAGLPIELTTDTDMTNALVEDNLGKVYKFTGTSDTYETDAIYIVSEV
jgi:hypothetical protein